MNLDSHRLAILTHKEIDDSWRNYLVEIQEYGIRQGDFRPDLDVITTATTIMVQLKAIGYQVTARSEAEQIDRLISQIATQVERWIMKDS